MIRRITLSSSSFLRPVCWGVAAIVAAGSIGADCGGAGDDGGDAEGAGGGGDAGTSGGTAGTGGGAAGVGGETGGTGGGTSDPCTDCLNANCPSEMSACGTGCWSLIQCVSQCYDDACAQVCVSQYPSDYDAANGITACAGNSCQTECNGGTGGSGGGTAGSGGGSGECPTPLSPYQSGDGWGNKFFLKAPHDCAVVSLPVVLEWEVDAVATPFKLQIGGNPATPENSKIFTIVTDVPNITAWTTPVSADMLQGLSSPDGWYSWRVGNPSETSWSESRAFKVQ